DWNGYLSGIHVSRSFSGSPLSRISRLSQRFATVISKSFPLVFSTYAGRLARHGAHHTTPRSCPFSRREAMLCTLPSDRNRVRVVPIFAASNRILSFASPEK